MTVVSSHLKRPEFKMRVLIVSALLAYAAAAPSGLVTPYIYQPVVLPAAGPTISPGDIQAAAINAQVQANDQARAAVDKVQEITDQAIENTNEKVVTDVDQINERNVEAFWSNEDKKWQALDSAQTAEAQIDGAAASNADLYAKAAIGGAIPYFAAASPVAPVIAAPVGPVINAPIAPVVYNPYLSALKTVSTQTVEIKAEDKKEENQEVTVEAAVKTTAPETPAPVEKTEEKPAEKPAETVNPAVFTSTLYSPLPNTFGYNLVAGVAPIIPQPIVKYASYPAIHGAFAPTLVQHVW